ncbi:MAG: carbohydrate porin, partial [Candidatus Nealsonbacteria bacterium]|nr:carbohydrate porin [Candidatus Nealsonbacteria bacterium]
GEVFTNMRGGISTRNATRYKGIFDLLLTANLDHYDLFPGGIVYLYGNQGHGRGITEEFVGDSLEISNIDFLHTMQVAEFWWEVALFDEFLRVRLGKQDANHDFAIVESAGDFINGCYGQHSNIPMPSWPDGAMGAALYFQLADRWELRTGVWDGAADGRTWGFSGTGETVSMLEVKTQYDLIDRLPGEFHAGVWYHNGQFGDLDGSPIHTGNHGVYLGADQAVFRENGDDGEDDQGLSAFVQYGWSREDRSEIPHYLGGGLVYKGLIGTRDEDRIGVAVAHAVFSDLLVGRSAETNVELFYKLQLAPYFSIQPDLQYVASPSGIYRDAFVAGLRVEVDL